MCRIFSELDSEDSAYRMAVVETVARILRDDNAMIYWIDGPDSEILAQTLKKRAPKLTVFSPRGGDVDVVVEARYAKDGRAAALVGEIPDSTDST